VSSGFCSLQIHRNSTLPSSSLQRLAISLKLFLSLLFSHQPNNAHPSKIRVSITPPSQSNPQKQHENVNEPPNQHRLSPATAASNSRQNRRSRSELRIRLPVDMVQPGSGGGVGSVRGVLSIPREEEPEEALQSWLLHFNFLLCPSLVRHCLQPLLVLSSGISIVFG
jgi:hypothetical protein